MPRWHNLVLRRIAIFVQSSCFAQAISRFKSEPWRVMVVEVELRSFITKEQYEHLLVFFEKQGKFVSADSQETHYFDSKEDVRIQKNNTFSKIWLKKGKMHDAMREEIEVKFAKDDFENVACIFSSIGLPIKIKWFRERKTFTWNDVSVMLDHTKGYGYIIEFEKLSDDSGKDAALGLLKKKMDELGVSLTPKEEFDRAFKNYELNWKKLTS